MADSQHGSSSDDDFVQQILADDSDDDNDFLSFEVYEIIGAWKVLLEIPVSNFEPESYVLYESDVHAGWTKTDSMTINPLLNDISKLNVKKEEY